MAKMEVKGLCKSYGRSEILKDIDMTVEQGEVVALIGPTGSGKTTFLRLIDLLEEPTEGDVIIDGVKVTGLSERERLKIRRKIAMVFQKPVMFRANVRENVSYGLKIRGETGIDKKVLEAISAVGLEGYEPRDANTLSGGEMQRIALARALVLEPDVLLLDEPTANLDPKTAASVDMLISRFEGTIIMATHNMLQARRLADRIAVLVEGRMIALGKPEEVLDAIGLSNLPEDLHSRSLVPW
jgi:ABC-type sugar transport system ATPase subunit